MIDATSSRGLGVSEDRQFLQIDEEKTTKAGEHYVVPLPFCNENFEIPNNRRQAMKRLMYLEDRFKRNQSYFADCKRFMDNLITKGYARREDTRPRGKTWFIPNHGVYHPSKPGKIRVVFDCNAELDEQSLNKELLTGPDLTNQIVGVLTRFRENSIAFMANIEPMYYQVMVPEHQQTFMKFLWWNDHNIDEDPIDFAMCAYVLGGASSASCANYALRRTSVDNVEESGKEAADICINMRISSICAGVVDLISQSLYQTARNYRFPFLRIKGDLV